MLTNLPAQSQIIRTADYPDYDTTLRKVTTEKDDEGASFEKDTAYTYDAFGNPHTVTVSSPDAIGSGTLDPGQDTGFAVRTTVTTYTPDGYFIQTVKDPMGHTTTIVNSDSATGQPTLVNDPNAVPTVYAYDAFGRKISEQIGDMNPVTIIYAAATTQCAPTAVYMVTTQQAGNTTKSACYDMLNRVVQTVTAGFTVGNDFYQTTVYDDQGRVIKVSEPYSQQDFDAGQVFYNISTYDVLNRIKTKTDAKGVGAAYSYEAFGNTLETQITVTPPDSPSYLNYELHSSLGKMLWTRDANGSETDFRYDAQGNPVLIQDAAGNQTLATYNILGQKISVSDPDQGNSSFAYDVLGELLQQTDAKSQQITMTYDLGGRLKSKVQPEGTTNWTYDSYAGCTNAIGKLCNVTQYDGYTETYDYDQDGRPVSTDELINLSHYVTSSAYDSDGRVSTVQYPATIADAAPVTTAAASKTTVLVNDPVVTLTGTATDSDSTTTTPMSYQWTVTSSTCNCATTLANPTSLQAQFTPSTPGIYTFQFTASDGFLKTSSSVTVTVQPQAPGTLSTSESYSYDGNFGVSWSAASGASAYNPTYKLYQSTDGGAHYVQVACPTCAQLTQSFTGMGSQTSNITYTYKVTASANGVEGPAGNTAAIPVYYPPSEPAPHALPTQSNWDRTFTVNWTASTGVSPTYTVKTAVVPDPGLQPIWVKGSCTTSSTSCVITETADGAYEAEVFSCNQATCNAPVVAAGSVNVWHQTPPAAPTISGTASVNDGSINISWTAPATATSYQLYYSWADQTMAYSAWAQVYNGTALTYSTTVPRGHYYNRYYVQACNQAGCGANSNTFTIINDESSGGGGCQTCLQTSPTPAPGSGTTAAPAPTSISSTQSGSPAIGPAPVEADPSALTLLAARPIVSVRNPQLAAEVHGTSTRAFDFAPPVYQAYADAHLEAATVTRQMVGVTVLYIYNADGYLLKMANNFDPSHVYWKATGVNARDQVTGELYGINSGVATITGHRDYYPESGYVENIQSGTGGSITSLQNLHYHWKELGNLDYRQDLRQNVSESFGYDILNRLTSGQVTNGAGVQPAVSYTYDALGNITTKSDVSSGTYVYGGVTNAGPHAVTSVPGVGSYGYDADGNMINRNGTAVTWNSDNMPMSIVQDASNQSQFNYAPDKHRYYQTATVTLNGVTKIETTTYVGALEIVTDGSGNGTHNRYNLSAYGKAVAIVDLESDSSTNPAISQEYLLTDHIGSVDVATDSTGTIVGGTGWSFEAFGKRRDPVSWQPPQDPAQVVKDRWKVTHRGFTGHEMLDNVGLIHMNGRVYDPTLGRFLSVDPVFQFATNGQSLNPYTYVLNNPLSLTDPSGYCVAGDLCFSGGEHNRDEKGNLITKDAQQIVDMKNGTTATVGSFLVSKDADGNVAITTSNGGSTSENSNDAQNKPSDNAGIGSPQQVSKTPSDGGQIPVTATDAASVEQSKIQTADINYNLAQSDRNANGGYGTITEAALAQFKAYDPEYKQSVAADHPYELTGLLYKGGDGGSRYYFSAMQQVPTAFHGYLGVEGIRQADIAGFTHTHPDNTMFNGLDYVVPAGGVPSFMRNSAGNAYQWDTAGAKRYEKYMQGNAQSGSVMSGETTISDPSRWGISSICPGGSPCIN